MSIKEDKEFGEFFAGPERGLPDPDNYEPNTKDELNLINAINWHTGGSPLKEKNVLVIQKLIQSGEYSDIFHEPKSQYVYRGIMVPKNEFQEFENKQFVFKPFQNRKSSSWTKDLNIAKGFSGESSRERSRSDSVILVAKITDNPNCFFDLSGWYNLIDDTYQKESEVVGFGDIFVEKLIYNIKNN